MKKVVFALPDAARVVSGTFEEQGDFRVLDGEVFHKDQLLMRSSEGHAVVRGGIAAQFDCDEVVFNAERGMWKLVTTEGETVMIKQATGVVVSVTEDETEEDAPAPRRGAKKPAGKPSKPARGSRRQADDLDDGDPDAEDDGEAEYEDDGEAEYEEEAPAPRRGAKKPAGKTATKPARGSSRQPAADPDDGEADYEDDGEDETEEEAPAPRRGAKKPAGKTARASADVDTDAFDWDD